ncbi:Oidioi.mRNA.OKI2018_I69.PAR.g9893.t1.cds [Oikopleura dioica]|uniref:Oidioi.mRNA.OKI2018_I69.PAR.g9893.t1.cds n=1 Tax=Oikopleura dioica TaxID=34765 RepID=A0ABN7RNR7_OIKDI|nr:Oidioi.mRNA.OKI2018_I69.PAR.g9893.t1.cds [Oikopleura dioica]
MSSTRPTSNNHSVQASILSSFLCNMKPDKKKQKAKQPTPGPQTAPHLVPLKKVVAVEDYEAKKDDELTIKQGEVVHLIEEEHDGWAVGIVDDRLGRFPTSVIEKKLVASELYLYGLLTFHKLVSSTLITNDRVYIIMRVAIAIWSLTLTTAGWEGNRSAFFGAYFPMAPATNFNEEKEYLLNKAVANMQSSLDQLSERIDRYPLNLDTGNDQDWNFYPDTYISGCTKNKCKSIKTLEEAKKQCIKSEDCFGITRENGEFQLRAGDSYSSSNGEHSWMLKLEKCNDELEGEHLINIAQMENLYEDLKDQRFRRPNGRCLYRAEFTHINKLLEFNPKLDFSTVHSPSACDFNNSTESILFGIKSMPESVNFRNSIRKTWVNHDLWSKLGFQIKVVFIIGQKENVNLKEEMTKNGDLLVLDFEESHYNLPYKDMAFLSFIKEKCSSADFVFKGDDDILLVPQNLINEISKIKYSPSIEAIGCKKGPELVIREPTSKYFIPNQIYPKPKWPLYFSGAGYLTTGEFSMNLAKVATEVQVVPLDDVWIGTLIEKMGKSENMARSETICAGVMNGFSIHDTCTVRGLTIVHKVWDSEIMPAAFANVVSKDFNCDEER